VGSESNNLSKMDAIGVKVIAGNSILGDAVGSAILGNGSYFPITSLNAANFSVGSPASLRGASKS
jgi:hypothetical protein